MIHDQTDAYWRRRRAVTDAFGHFEGVTEVRVQFVDTYAQATVAGRRDFVQLHVPHDWEETVLSAGLTDVRYVFPVAAVPIDAGRPDVSLYASRYITFGYLLEQPAPDWPWRYTGGRRLEGLLSGAREGFIARTPCGLGKAFHETAAGAVIRAVRARGRERAWMAKAEAGMFAAGL